MYYTAKFERDDDGWLVSFPALPEAITSGTDRQNATRNGLDALEVVLLTYAKDGRALPPDVSAEGDVERMFPSAQVVAKLALIKAFNDSGLTRVAFAKRLGGHENEIRRLLDPYHGSKLPAIEAAMLALGKRIVLTVDEAA